MKMIDDDGVEMERCHCEGGELWTECCNGAGGCDCRGQQVYMGSCRVCHGAGWVRPGTKSNANLDAIRAMAPGGYLGNPYGRLR